MTVVSSLGVHLDCIFEAQIETNVVKTHRQKGFLNWCWDQTFGWCLSVEGELGSSKVDVGTSLMEI